MTQTDPTLPNPPPAYSGSETSPAGDSAPPYAQRTGILSAASYFQMRPAPTAAQAGECATHTFNIAPGTQASAIRYPKPENLWMSRDVDREDWSTFLSYLIPREQNSRANSVRDNKIQDDGTLPFQETELARRRRINHLVSEWNDEFFQPRGLKVKPEFEPAQPATKTEAPPQGFTMGKHGMGLGIGSSLVGVALPPNSSGFGLRLGNVLLGVTYPEKSSENDDEDLEKR